MNGKLAHEAFNYNTKRCEVEKWILLPHSDFERLKVNQYKAITAAKDLMYEDKEVYHCIMLLDEYGNDGLLIEAEGFDYPRYAMFISDSLSIYDKNRPSNSFNTIMIYQVLSTILKYTHLAIQAYLF